MSFRTKMLLFRFQVGFVEAQFYAEKGGGWEVLKAAHTCSVGLNF